MSTTEYNINVIIEKEPYNYGSCTVTTVNVTEPGSDKPVFDSIVEQIARAIAAKRGTRIILDQDDPERDGLDSYVKEVNLISEGTVQVVVKHPNID